MGYNMFTTLNIRYELADVFQAFNQSNLNGKLIVVMLLAGSIFAWSIMITKFLECKNVKRLSELFLRQYKKQPFLTRIFAGAAGSQESSPLLSIYTKVCERLAVMLKAQNSDIIEFFSGTLQTGFVSLKESEIQILRETADQTVIEESLALEKNMGFLAIAVTAAPFLGLLGTVWGVMDAFGGIAVAGSTTLSAIAPGISSALLTTVVGLLVALPSVIGYNILTHRIRNMVVGMEGFAIDLVADLESKLIQSQGNSKWHANLD